jgi:hypothetical protein
VRALTRIADEESEEELIVLARHLTASQLERALRAYRRVSLEEANALADAAYAGYSWDEDGSLILRARLAPEDGALFLRALDAARDRLQEREWPAERGSAEPQSLCGGRATPRRWQRWLSRHLRARAMADPEVRGTSSSSTSRKRRSTARSLLRCG